MAADVMEERGVEILGRVRVDSRLLGEKLDKEAVTLLFRLLVKESTRRTRELLVEEKLEKTVLKELK
jgi:Arc/MetJ family transcription regulator